MPRHARRRSTSGIYHVILRGANRQEIFHKEKDRIRFLYTLNRYRTEIGIQVLAWCLMDNHVHLLLRENEHNLSDLMKRLGISYASYYNWSYGTNGHLFQDRFKSEVVESYGYLVRVVRYIHMNPVKAGLSPKPEKYWWSSCANYYGLSRESSDLLDQSIVLSYFPSEKESAQTKLKQFHELQCDDECLRAWAGRRLTDEQARIEIIEVLDGVQIPQVKTLEKKERDPLIRIIKEIEGLSLRQIARILGVSVYMVSRA
ncbi:transposase [Halobacillus locisalis]|uniref:Transposase n=1 Tax=Halobacillus locisalis TaxID=220753 RepID=A0A838CUX6_9BACI|nr:transposase [Halobacillus locisalis]MBA2175416.1 transposase [Halobacillus locisalis]